jgi:hypothetical protein
VKFACGRSRPDAWLAESVNAGLLAALGVGGEEQLLAANEILLDVADALPVAASLPGEDIKGSVRRRECIQNRDSSRQSLSS